MDTEGSGHGALAGFLKAAQADALICGGIGMGARNALAEAGIRLYGGVQGSADAAALALADAGIKLYGGVQGSADAAAKALAEGKLDYDPNARCDHHDHHHGEDHDCGHHGHGCGGHGGAC